MNPIMRRSTQPFFPEVAVIGGGMGGLNAAYALTKQRVPTAVYEGNYQFGGRVQSMPSGWAPIELGAEFIDSSHTHLLDLAKHLRLPLDDRRHLREFEVYHTRAGSFTPLECYDPQTGRGALAGVLAAVADDAKKIATTDGTWNARAQELDRLSMADYLQQLQKKLQTHAAPAALVQLIQEGYCAQFGKEASHISALCFVSLLAPDLEKPFRIFGNSDEAFHIHGGNAALINGLHQAILTHKRMGSKVEMHTSKILTEAERVDDGWRLHFDGGSEPVSCKKLVLAMPLTMVRRLKNWEQLFDVEDTKWAVERAQYGNNTKVTLAVHLPQPATHHLPLLRPMEFGVFYTDTPELQNAWVRLPENPKDPAIFTFLIGGNAVDAEHISQHCRHALEGLLQVPPRSLQVEVMALNAWQHHAFSHGSYPCPTLGYLTQYQQALLAHNQTTKNGLYLAGDHMDPIFYGHMEGAARSGAEVAKIIEKSQARARF